MLDTDLRPRSAARRIRPAVRAVRPLATALALALVVRPVAPATGAPVPDGSVPDPAQEVDVSGSWSVTYDQATTNRNGTVEVVRRGTAELTLVQEGDSISGRLLGGIFCDGEPCPVTGSVQGRKVRFSTGSWRVQGHSSTTEWTGTLEGGTLRGDLSLYLDGRLMDPRSWQAERTGG